MIICAAIKRWDDIIRWHRHSDCIYTAVTNYWWHSPVHSWEMWFINSDNKFVTRQEAHKEFIECGQWMPQEAEDLYSEDLY